MTQSPLALTPKLGSSGLISVSKSLVLAKPSTSPSPKRLPPFTTSSINCSISISIHLFSPRLPTRLSGFKTLNESCNLSKTTFPLAHTLERYSPISSKLLAIGVAYGIQGSLESGLYGLPRTRTTLPLCFSILTRTPQCVVQPLHTLFAMVYFSLGVNLPSRMVYSEASALK